MELDRVDHELFDVAVACKRKYEAVSRYVLHDVNFVDFAEATVAHRAPRAERPA